MSTPLYLHFLDRELARALNFRIPEEEVERVLRILVLGTSSKMYCGLSLLWESIQLASPSEKLCALLIQTKILDTVSHYSNVDEFLESRKLLYQHDMKRYTMYFDAGSFNHRRRLLLPTQYKESSTTTALHKELLTWSMSSSLTEGNLKNAIDEKKLRTSVVDILKERNEKAITASIFNSIQKGCGPKGIVFGLILRRITEAYTNHYLDFGSGDLATGINGLTVFDGLSRNFPLYDVVILSKLLRRFGFGKYVELTWTTDRRFWETVSQWRTSYYHQEFCRLLNVIVSCFAPKEEELSKYAIRNAIIQKLARISIDKGSKSVSPTRIHEHALQEVYGSISVLRQDAELAANLEMLMQKENMVTDVLLVVATELERDVLLKKAVQVTGHECTRIFGKRRTYYQIGRMGGAMVAAVQSEMGSTSPGASHSSVSDAIDELNPSFIIGVGIAFGIDREKQEIGQILVSKQIVNYELQRVSIGDINIRGDRVTSSTTLLGRVRAATAGWEGGRVKFGLMLSGEKLIDNEDYRDSILEKEPESIGGEMEGVGLYAAAVERNKDWIIIKGISDWADGRKKFKKGDRQVVAANNAIDLTIRTISLGGFVGRKRV